MMHPGPRPPDFEFPFAQARRLQDACSRLATSARRARERSNSVYAYAQQDFTGQARQACDQGAERISDRTDELADQAERQAERVGKAIAEARRMEAAAADALRQWNADVDAYEAEQASQREEAMAR